MYARTFSVLYGVPLSPAAHRLPEKCYTEWQLHRIAVCRKKKWHQIAAKMGFNIEDLMN